MALERADLSAHCIANFASKFTQSHGCWFWQAARYPKGYGMVYVGRQDGRQVNNYAHRVAYVLAKGPIPAGKVVMHSCDNPPCVNPAHLILGTQADNVRDCRDKGRYRAPRHLDRRTLSDGDVQAIRASFARGRDLAACYRVTAAHISLIRNGWRRKAA